MNEGRRPLRRGRRAGIFMVSVAGLVALLVASLVGGVLLADWRAELAAPPAASPAAPPPPKPTAEASLDPLAQVPGRLLFVPRSGSTLRLLEGGVWSDIELPSPLHVAPPDPRYAGSGPYAALSQDGERVSAIISEASQVRLWSRDLVSGVESLVDLPYGPNPEGFSGWIDPARRFVYFRGPSPTEMIMVDVDGRLDRLALEGRQTHGIGRLDERSLVVGLRQPDPATATGEILVWRPEGIEVLARGLVFPSFGSIAAHPSGAVAVKVGLEDGEAVLLLPEGRILARASDFDALFTDPSAVDAPTSLRLRTWNAPGTVLAIEVSRSSPAGSLGFTSHGMVLAVVDRAGEVLLVIDGELLDPHIDEAYSQDAAASVLSFRSVVWNDAGDGLAISGTQHGGRSFAAVVQLDGRVRLAFNAPEGLWVIGASWGASDMLAVSVIPVSRQTEATGRIVVFDAEGDVRLELPIAMDIVLRMSPDGEWAATSICHSASLCEWTFVSLLTGATVEMGQLPLRGWAR